MPTCPDHDRTARGLVCRGCVKNPTPMKVSEGDLRQLHDGCFHHHHGDDVFDAIDSISDAFDGGD